MFHVLSSVDMLLDFGFFWIEKEEKHEEPDSTELESVTKVVEEIVGIEMKRDKLLVSVLII